MTVRTNEHDRMHRGERKLFKCVLTAVTTLCKLSSILFRHSTLMAQGQSTVMQDLAGHEQSA